jgi:hypothetical protein
MVRFDEITPHFPPESPAMAAPPALFLATFTTRHYGDFTALGRTEEEAREAVVVGWRRNCAQDPDASLGYCTPDRISVCKMTVGVPYKDDEEMPEGGFCLAAAPYDDDGGDDLVCNLSAGHGGEWHQVRGGVDGHVPLMKWRTIG